MARVLPVKEASSRGRAAPVPPMAKSENVEQSVLDTADNPLGVCGVPSAPAAHVPAEGRLIKRILAKSVIAAPPRLVNPVALT